MNVFQDESGDLGFKAGSSKFFVIALLCPKDSKHFGHVIRKFKGHLIRVGWPNTIEIKATHLHMAQYEDSIPDDYKYKSTPDAPILEIAEKIAKCNVEIDAIIVNKAKINSNLRTLPYGVLYNYFSRTVLTERLIKYDDVKLFIDRTSKQTHNIKHFDDYILTEALLAKGRNFNVSIEHGDSNVVAGISAVDFISWSISRKYEQNDDRFWDKFKHKVASFKCLYF